MELSKAGNKLHSIGNLLPNLKTEIPRQDISVFFIA